MSLFSSTWQYLPTYLMCKVVASFNNKKYGLFKKLLSKRVSISERKMFHTQHAEHIAKINVTLPYIITAKNLNNRSL